jgi:predicted Fe-Mo cluster-binding NifX family protein
MQWTTTLAIAKMYTVFTIGKVTKIENSEIVPSPQGCGCKSNIASVLKEMGVTTLLAGNMGDGALNVLNRNGHSSI